MAENNRDSVVSTGGWLLFMLVMCIPIVNIIVIFYEAFSSSSNRNLQGWCRAVLIWYLFAIIFVVAVLMSSGALLEKIGENINITNWEQTIKNMNNDSDAASDSAE